MQKKSDLPFSEEVNNTYHIRTFSSKLKETELKWHFDEEDRIVICEIETDWQFQMDDELPYKIEKNKPIYIPKGKYHRIIKGEKDLTVKIKKIDY